MRTPAPLDPRIARRAFLTREALALGVGPGRLRRSDLASPFRGIRIPAGIDLTFVERCAVIKRVLNRGDVFSHGTAARLIGIPVPVGMLHDRLLHVSVPPPNRASKARGIIGHQLRLTESEKDVVGGLPVTSPERTWCDLASAMSVRELVAAGDFLIARKRPIATRARLAAAARSRRGRPGAPRLLEALSLLSERAESPPESLLRVMLIEAGLPNLDVNVDLRDTHGRFVARPDLRFPDYRLIVEYEGDGHRTERKQWRTDITRTARLQVLGEEVLRVAADDLADERRLVDVVSTLLTRRGWSAT